MKKLAIFYFSLPAVTALVLAACNAGNDVQGDKSWKPLKNQL